MTKRATASDSQASQRISAYIASYADWHGDMLTRIREIVLSADSGLREEWKWNTPVWSANGLVCAATAFQSHVKINFFKGAALEDPQGLFNAGLEAKTMRSIDLRQGDRIRVSALRRMVKAAVARNSADR